jgi:hypothetical protein
VPSHLFYFSIPVRTSPNRAPRRCSGRYLADGRRSNQRPATWPHHGARGFREQTSPDYDGALSPNM